MKTPIVPPVGGRGGPKKRHANLTIRPDLLGRVERMRRILARKGLSLNLSAILEAAIEANLDALEKEHGTA